MSSDPKPKLRPEDVAATTAVGAATRIGTGMARRAATAEGAGAGATGSRKSAAKKPVWPVAILVVVVLAVMLAIMLRFGQ